MRSGARYLTEDENSTHYPCIVPASQTTSITLATNGTAYTYIAIGGIADGKREMTFRVSTSDRATELVRTIRAGARRRLLGKHGSFLDDCEESIDEDFEESDEGEGHPLSPVPGQ